MVSVSSMASVAGALLGYIVFIFAGYLSFHWAVLGFILIAGSIVIIRHRANIARILRGNEPRLGQRRSPST
jgi:glycerol-3-phosphate acyltransferase PlsY